MKKILLLAIAVGLYSCQPEEVEPADNVNTVVVVPTPSTLKLQRDFNPLAGYQNSSFRYFHVDGTERFVNNPLPMEVDSVDFTRPLRITAYAGNNLDPQVLCNWNLKKDGVVIEVQNVQYFVYEN
jgi:hypothetical protein